MPTALRRRATPCAVLAAVVCVAAAPASSVPGAVVAKAIYVVRLDPRLCPSPTCGGYWLTLANKSRTRCHDGRLRARCYVAAAVDADIRRPVPGGLPDGALVRAALGSKSYGGAGDLGIAYVAETWAPAGRAPLAGPFFRVRDTGIVCVRAPCFSYRSVRVNTRIGPTFSRVDLRAARATTGELARAQAALRAPGGLIVAGGVAATPDGGTALVASRLYLRVLRPRA